MYGDLAPWFHLLTAPAEYSDDASFVLAALREHADGPIETLLELGSGGGNTASHLKHDLRLTLTDLSPQMLALSATLNPECEHLVGDMRTLRLGRTFDTVLAHDAICYMTTDADLRAAMTTAFEHLRSGGAAVFMPDHIRETFAEGTDHGGHDGPGLAGGPPGRACATWSGPPIPIPTTRPTRSTTQSSCGTPMTRLRCARTGISKGCFRARPGSTCSPASGSRPSLSSTRRPGRCSSASGRGQPLIG